MGANGTELQLRILLERWFELTVKQRELVETQAPVAALQAVIAAKEELISKMAQILPNAPGGDFLQQASLVDQILREEEQVRELLTRWLGKVREEIARVRQQREAARAYLSTNLAYLGGGSGWQRGKA